MKNNNLMGELQHQRLSDNREWINMSCFEFLQKNSRAVGHKWVRLWRNRFGKWKIPPPWREDNFVEFFLTLIIAGPSGGQLAWKGGIMKVPFDFLDFPVSPSWSCIRKTHLAAGSCRECHLFYNSPSFVHALSGKSEAKKLVENSFIWISK